MRANNHISERIAGQYCQSLASEQFAIPPSHSVSANKDESSGKKMLRPRSTVGGPLATANCVPVAWQPSGQMKEYVASAERVVKRFSPRKFAAQALDVRRSEIALHYKYYGNRIFGRKSVFNRWHKHTYASRVRISIWKFQIRIGCSTSAFVQLITSVQVNLHFTLFCRFFIELDLTTRLLTTVEWKKCAEINCLIHRHRHRWSE